MEDNGTQYLGTREYMTPEKVQTAAYAVWKEFRRRGWKPTGELWIAFNDGGIRRMSVTQQFEGSDVLPESMRLP